MGDHVHVEATVRGTWPVGVLMEGWSADEKRALNNGDEEAREALREEALRQTLNSPDDVEMVL